MPDDRAPDDELNASTAAPAPADDTTTSAPSTSVKTEAPDAPETTAPGAKSEDAEGDAVDPTSAEADSDRIEKTTGPEAAEDVKTSVSESSKPGAVTEEKDDGEVAEDEPDDVEVNAALKSAGDAPDAAETTDTATEGDGATASAPAAGDATTADAEDGALLSSSADTRHSSSGPDEAHEDGEAQPTTTTSATATSSSKSKKKSSKKGKSSKKSGSKSRKSSAARASTDREADASGEGEGDAEPADETLTAAEEAKKEANGDDAGAGETSAHTDGSTDDTAADGVDAKTKDGDEDEDEGEEGDASTSTSKKKSSSGGSSSGTSQRAVSAAKELAYLGLQNLGDGEQEPILPRRSRRAAFDLQTAQELEQAHAEDAATAGPVAAGAAGAVSGAADEDEGMDVEPYAEQEGDAGDEGVTRCVCGSTDENVGLMIQCEDCKCWQHCICMGMEFEDDCPDVYFCEQCKPELHIPLLKSLGVLKENGAFGNHKAGGATGKKGVIMGPNGKPSKNPARDQARELREAKEAVARLAQENALRHRQAAVAAEQEAGAPAKERKSSSSHDRSRKRSESRDVDSGGGAAAAGSVTPGYSFSGAADPNGAMGPAAGGPGAAAAGAAGAAAAAAAGGPYPSLKSPKRRSTMNSRESAYGWEPIPPGLLNEDEVWDDVPVERSSRKRQRSVKEEDGEEISDEEVGPAEQSKRRRLSVTSKVQDEPDLPAPPRSHKKKPKSKSKAPEESNAPARPKHPNQYTYRPKNKPAEAAPPSKADVRAEEATPRSATPALGRPVSPTPSPSKNRDRRGAAAAHSRTGTPAPNSNPGAAWGLPEHLWSLAHYLPAAAPAPLTVHVPSTKGISRGAVAAAAAERSSSKRGGAGGSGDSAPTATAHPFNVLELTESSSRVRFPGKRMTVGEMRKRVRNISEFVTRMQVEAVERGRRTASLGIQPGGGLAHDPLLVGLGAGAGAAAVPADGAVPMEVDGKPADGDEAKPNGGGDGGASSADDSSRAPGPAAVGNVADATSPAKAGASSEAASTETPSTAVVRSAETAQLPQSMLLLEALTAELVAFQRKFGLSGPVASMAAAATGAVHGAVAASVNQAAAVASGGQPMSAGPSGLGLDLGTTSAATVVLDG